MRRSGDPNRVGTRNNIAMGGHTTLAATKDCVCFVLIVLFCSRLRGPVCERGALDFRREATMLPLLGLVFSQCRKELACPVFGKLDPPFITRGPESADGVVEALVGRIASGLPVPREREGSCCATTRRSATQLSTYCPRECGRDGPSSANGTWRARSPNHPCCKPGK